MKPAPHSFPGSIFFCLLRHDAPQEYPCNGFATYGVCDSLKRGPDIDKNLYLYTVSAYVLQVPPTFTCRMGI